MFLYVLRLQPITTQITSCHSQNGNTRNPRRAHRHVRARWCRDYVVRAALRDFLTCDACILANYRTAFARLSRTVFGLGVAYATTNDFPHAVEHVHQLLYIFSYHCDRLSLDLGRCPLGACSHACSTTPRPHAPCPHAPCAECSKPCDRDLAGRGERAWPCGTISGPLAVPEARVTRRCPRGRFPFRRCHRLERKGPAAPRG